jgi:TPP-dependent 2-oxoacid decarboxylase
MGKRIMSKTVIQHVLSRLHELGISDIFGEAGDFAFPIDDAVSTAETMRRSIAATSSMLRMALRASMA